MDTYTYTVGQDLDGTRLDRALTSKQPDYSRSYYKELITDNCVTVNGTIVSKPSCPLKTGDTITITIPPARPLGALPLPDEDLGVRLVYEHTDFLIVYKPAGLLVHAPSDKSTEVSLVDWLVHTFSELKNVGPQDRPGIVHRLDKGTSGLLIVPRNNKALATFGTMFQERRIEKTYIALTEGHIDASGSINEPIGRDPILRHKMAVTLAGKEALTHYKALEYFDEATVLELRIITGRTHQIRVHCAYLGYPLLGDSTYGKEHKRIKRPALHATSIGFTYQEKWYSFSCGIPADMQALKKSLSPLAQRDAS